MLDTKGNESKEQSFEEQLKQAKSQGEDEREKARILLKELEEYIANDRKEYIENCIQNAYDRIKRNLENKVKKGEVSKSKNKNRVYTYHVFESRGRVPTKTETKIIEAASKISCLYKNTQICDIVRHKIPEMCNGLAYDYINKEFYYEIGKKEGEGSIFHYRLSDKNIYFAEKLERLLLRDGIKLEGIVAYLLDYYDYFKLEREDIKPGIKTIKGKRFTFEPRALGLALKFSMEF